MRAGSAAFTPPQRRELRMRMKLQEATFIGTCSANAASKEDWALVSLDAVIPTASAAAAQWEPYVRRYSSGEWRALAFRDLILADSLALKTRRDKLTFLDIGCGRGFDGSSRLQRSLAEAAERYIGVEPDESVELGDVFAATHRCFFEDAPIEDESIDIAFAVMVLEHIPDPQKFWKKVHRVLRKGGCFWGFTVDARHWFFLMSTLMEKLRVKDLYLNKLHGKRGEERYENYPVFYRINTPRQVANLTADFSASTILNFNRIGQLDFYVPKKLRWLAHSMDSLAIRAGWPGSVMAMRVEK
jgi:SAM-dependent methyltransferase